MAEDWLTLSILDLANLIRDLFIHLNLLIHHKNLSLPIQYYIYHKFTGNLKERREKKHPNMASKERNSTEIKTDIKKKQLKIVKE